MLSHHVVIRDGKIANYHPYPPTCWNASPRDSDGVPGPYEDAIQNTPIFEENDPDDFKGIDILRTCAVSIPACPAASICTWVPGGRFWPSIRQCSAFLGIRERCMSGHHPPVVSSSGRGPAPRSGGRNGNSIVAPLVPDPSSVEEAEAILKQMARAVSLKQADFAAAPARERTKTQEADKRPTAAKLRASSARDRQSESVLRSLVESAPDALVVIDREGTILLINLQTEKLFGYNREELIGEKIELLVPERLRERHVGDRDRFFRYPDSRPMGIGLTLFGRRKDGQEFPVEISLSPLQGDDGPLATAAVRDITDRKRMEVRYRTLVEGIPAVTFMAALDEGDNEFYVSPQIEVMLGFTQEEWLGDPFLWYRQLHPDDRQRWGTEFARTCASGRQLPV